MQRNRLRWYGHAQRSPGWINEITKYNMEGSVSKGLPLKNWNEAVRNDKAWTRPGIWRILNRMTGLYGEKACSLPYNCRTHNESRKSDIKCINNINKTTFC